MEKVLGLITARGGSKSIPRKNIATLAGRPLLSYTCDAALNSRVLARVVLSTDDEEIAGVGRESGVEVPFLRPAELATDETPSVDVAEHAVRWLADREGWQAEVVVLLQPTSPLRQARHIDEALGRMEDIDADTVVSVMPVPHRFSPFNIMRMEGALLQDFWQDRVGFDRFRRQNLPVLYARNGPAVLASRASLILASHTFYGARVAPYLMSEEESVDIDTDFDLRLAEWLISQRAESC
jgi:CMP-N,N'-diacetyllegionaminic acid synthase